MFEPGHGIHGSFEPRPRIDLGRTHDGLQGLDQPQGENRPIEAPSGGDNDRFTSTAIHNFDRSPAGERTSQASLAIHAPGHLQSVSLSKLESREEATDQVQDTSFANGRGSQDNSGNQRMSPRLSGDSEVPQPEENVQRDGQSSALLVDSEPQSSTKSMAPAAAFSLSQFLAAHSGSPQTRQSSAQSVSKNPPATVGEALRPFVNSNGVNCFANSSCLGLAWLSQVIGVEAMDWSDQGNFQKTCFENTLQPLDVLIHFSTIMKPWLTVERQQRQHDINEFLSHLLTLPATKLSEHGVVAKMDTTWGPISRTES